MTVSAASERSNDPGLDRYAVLGNPIAHSRSPSIHARFAAQTGQPISYEKLLVPLGGFAAAVASFVAAGGRGANVTVPFKIDACALADYLSTRAAAAGAVNTLRFENGRVFGDNTDGIGLVTDLTVNAGVALQGKRILLVGAGGAAQGVILPLLDQQPAQLVIANRTESKARQVAARFTSDVLDVCPLEVLDGPFDVVINATAASLGNAVPAIPVSVFSSHTLAYDMMYGPEPTAFMRFAAGHGAAVRDGLGMLVEQAAEAFLVWRGVRPATAEVLAALRSTIKGSAA